MVQLLGRISKNAKVSDVKGGKKVVNFSIALNDSFKDKDGNWVDQTTFVNCSYWLSEKVAKILKNGAIVSLSGRLIPRIYINKEGQPIPVIDCNVDDITLIAFAPKKGNAAPQPTAAADITEPIDDLPF